MTALHRLFDNLTLQEKLDTGLTCPCEHNIPEPCRTVGTRLLCELNPAERTSRAKRILKDMQPLVTPVEGRHPPTSLV